MEKIPKRIICLLTVIILLWAHVPVVHAEALPDVISGSSTIADIVMTYYAIGGSAVANPEWINTLYGSLGDTFGTIADFAENGMLLMNETGQWVASGGLEEAIANAPAYQSLGLDQVFNVSAEEVTAGGGFAASTGAATLAGAAGAVGSTGVIPLLGGVTAAYWGGIGIGTLINHLTGNYAKEITLGLPINRGQIANDVPAGSGSIYYYADSGTGSIANEVIYFSNALGLCIYCIEDGKYIFYSTFYIPGANGTINGSRKSYLYNQTFNYRANFANGLYVSGLSNVNPSDYAIFNLPVPNRRFSNRTALNEYISSVRNGSVVPTVFSPDVIGPSGNQVGTYDAENQEYNVPDMLPQIDPGVQSGKPLTLQDWLNFANAVNNNNSQTNPIPDNQALFDNILDLIKQNLPGDNPNPNPNPGGDPYSPPVVTPVPDPSYPDPVPDQPTSENPDESENPQETEPLDPVDTGKPWMLPDLTKKFPFCIPWDIKDCFTLLKSNIRQAPHISWRFNPPNTPIDYTFNLDLSDFEPVAVLLRTLELIAFIAGLAFATRYLIGAS